MILVENFNSLFFNFQRFKDSVIFVVAKPVYKDINLEELLVKYSFCELYKKYVVLQFDSNTCRSIGRFFNVKPFYIKIFCFIPEKSNLFGNELCWDDEEDLADWLKHLFFRIRGSLR